jgi:DeoR/GlpR family transcriptional regulator of sugar metabolism
MFVLEGQAGGQRRQRAIDQAAERFGVDRRTIRRDLKALIGTEKKRQRAIGQ